MKPMQPGAIKALNLGDALEQEADAPHAWLPAEPAWPSLRQHKGAVLATLTKQLATGYAPRREWVVNMRKASFAVRPLAVWWPLDRIVYRALVNKVLAGETFDQSGAAYLAFINGPANEAMKITKKPTGGFTVKLPTDGYVVKSDVASFYQYVDHRILAEQLLLLSDEYDSIDALVELLSAASGREFGLPQMLQPSDRLADVYVQSVERAMIRVGRQVWRYNDDFRIACGTYSDALNVIEQFAVAARSVGLVMNENKTGIVKIGRYINHDTPFHVEGDQVTIEKSGMLADEFAAEYDQQIESDTDPGAAIEIIGSATVDDVPQTPGDAPAQGASPDPFSTERPPINVAAPSGPQVRVLRRALRKLSRLKDASAVPKTAMLIGYIPNLTPAVLGYLSVLPAGSAGVSDALDQIAQLSLNSWQQMWLADALQARVTIDGSLTDVQRAWVERTSSEGTESLARAHVLRCGASTGVIGVDVVVPVMAAAPEVLAQWHAAALDTVLTDSKRRQAFKDSEPLYSWMMK